MAITSTQLTGTTITVPSTVYTSSSTNAITTIALCNTGAVTITDESVNTCNVNVYLVKSGDTADVDNLIVSNLTIPAGETVFFSDEKIILDGGDEIHIKADDANLISVTVSSLAV